MGCTSTPGFEVEVDTLAHGIVETSSGTLISITSTMAAAREQVVTIEAYGERGTAIYRNLPLPSLRFTGVRIHKEPPPELGVHALQSSQAGHLGDRCGMFHHTPGQDRRRHTELLDRERAAAARCPV